MRRILLGLMAAAALLLTARWAWIAMAPEPTRIRWRLEEMSAGFNETRLAPCLRGVADDWRHTGSGLDRDRLADVLRSVFFHEQDAQTGRFPLHTQIEPASLEITLDPDDPTRAQARFVGDFAVLEGGAWSTAWRARLTLELVKHAEHGWQVARSAHEDLQADGRFLGVHAVPR